MSVKIGERSAREIRMEILAFLTAFAKQHGYGPSMREIGDAVGLRSTSTVSRYVESMRREGLLSAREGRPRTVTTAHPPVRNIREREVMRQRIRIETADGGCLYLDCTMEKLKGVPVELSFDGVLDAEKLKEKVSRIVAFSIDKSKEANENEQDERDTRRDGDDGLHDEPRNNNAKKSEVE